MSSGGRSRWTTREMCTWGAATTPPISRRPTRGRRPTNGTRTARSGGSRSTGSYTSTPLPTSLNGVSVAVNGATVPLLYVSPGQINFQLPYETATGTASATVTSGCGPSAPVAFPVASAAPYLLPGAPGD